MLPFWIDLGSLPLMELLPLLVTGVTLFLLPAFAGSGAASH